MTPEQIEIIRTSLLGLDPSLIPGDLRTLLLADINSVLTEVGGLGFTESIDQSIGGGSSGGGGGGAVVPEPSSGVLLLFGITALCWYRRQAFLSS